MSGKVGLPVGTRAKFCGEGVIVSGHGGLAVRVEDAAGVPFWIACDLLASVEPLPVVPEPGKWYGQTNGGSPKDPLLALPGGSWAAWEPSGYRIVGAREVSGFGPLVECEPPAEFRDGNR